MTRLGPDIEIHSTSGSYRVATSAGEPLLESLRRAGLPSLAYLLATADGGFQSLSQPIPAGGLTLSALRNPDFDIITPRYELVVADEPVAEVFEYAGDPPRARLRQLSRDDAIAFTYASVESVLQEAQGRGPIQLALSSGGDGRALAECVSRYVADHPDVAITAVITSTGFEDPISHVREAVAIADQYDIAYEVFDEDAAARILGYSAPLETVARAFSSAFPQDELEVLGTYCEVKTRYWQILDDAISAGEASTGLLALAGDYRTAYPSAMRVIDDHVDQRVAHLRFPLEHRKRTRSTNLLERTFVEVRRRTKIIGRFPGETSALSLIWAVLELASRGWRGVTMTPKAVAQIERIRRGQTTHADLSATLADQEVVAA